MRTRKEIEQHLNPHIDEMDGEATPFEVSQLTLATNALMLEVLLDIRDQLESITRPNLPV